MLIEFVILFLIAIIAGLIGALVGIGGGIIIVPALSLILNLPIHTAIAASLISVIATSVAGAHRYVEQQITNIRLGIFLEVSTTAGAFCGALLALILQGSILSIIFGVLVFYMAIFSYRTRSYDDNIQFSTDKDEQKKFESYLAIKDFYYDQSLKRDIYYTVKRPLAGSVISYFAGVGSGLLGIGGGIIKVAVMNTMMGIPIKVAVATSKFMIGVTAAASSVLYFLTGSVNLFVVAPVALGTMIGASFGSSIMNRFKNKYIKLLFTFIAGYLSLRMILKGLSEGYNINIF